MYAILKDEFDNEIGAVMTNHSLSFADVLNLIDTTHLDYEVTEECAYIETVTDAEYNATH